MALKPRLFAAIAGFVWLGVSTAAQAQEAYKIRLSPVPIDVSMQNVVAGKGTGSAVLTGAKLSITGSFDGLRTPATIAQIHQAPVTGVRGPVFADVTVSKAISGTVSGSVDLNAAQIESLRKGRLYIQIHSEKAPDGNLWGWLLR
jgi:hypothetical protein